MEDYSDAIFVGEQPYDHAGYSVARVGDVNGDGYADFLIGAHGNDDAENSAGKTYLFLGRAEVEWGAGCSLADDDASFVGGSAI